MSFRSSAWLRWVGCLLFCFLKSSLFCKAASVLGSVIFIPVRKTHSRKFYLWMKKVDLKMCMHVWGGKWCGGSTCGLGIIGLVIVSCLLPVWTRRNSLPSPACRVLIFEMRKFTVIPSWYDLRSQYYSQTWLCVSLYIHTSFHLICVFIHMYLIFTQPPISVIYIVISIAV